MRQDKILVTQSSMPTLEEYIDEIRDIWDSHWLTNMGSKHKAFRQSYPSIWKCRISNY